MNAARDTQRRARRAQQRSERDQARRVRGQQQTTAAEDYRVPAGRIALTFDSEGSELGTIEIDAGSLADMVAEIGKHVAGWPYQRALHMLAAIHRSWKQGQPRTESGLLLGFWAALNHPASGNAMRQRIADRMAKGEPVHITMFAARSGGVAFALGDRFTDLGDMLRASKAAGIGVLMSEGGYPADGRTVQ